MNERITNNSKNPVTYLLDISLLLSVKIFVQSTWHAMVYIFGKTT